MSTETLAISSELLARIEHLYVSTRSVLDAIPSDRYDEKLPSGMTLREVLAHLAAWEETVPPRVEHALATGQDLKGYEDIDGFNAKVAAEMRDANIDDLKKRLAHSHAAVVEVVRSFEGREVPELARKIVVEEHWLRYGVSGRRKTLPFNGYADQVASLYAGMDLRRSY